MTRPRVYMRLVAICELGGWITQFSQATHISCVTASAPLCLGTSATHLRNSATRCGGCRTLASAALRAPYQTRPCTRTHCSNGSARSHLRNSMRSARSSRPSRVFATHIRRLRSRKSAPLRLNKPLPIYAKGSVTSTPLHVGKSPRLCAEGSLSCTNVLDPFRLCASAHNQTPHPYKIQSSIS